MSLHLWVDSASDGIGATGATENLTGAGCAFKEPADALNSLTSWPGTLSTDVTIECKASTGLAYTATCNQAVMDQVTSAVNRLTITTKVGHRHAGKWSPAKVRFELTDQHGFYNNYGSHVKIEWMQVMIKVTTSTGSNNYNCYRLTTANNQSANIDHRIEHCLGRRDPTSTGTDHVFGTINSDPNGGGFTGTCKVDVCTFWDCYAGVSSDGTAWAAANYSILNITAIDNQINFLDLMICKNCLSFNPTLGAGGFLSTGSTGHENNASDDSSALGTSPRNVAAGLFKFVDYANDDFHLASDDSAVTGFGKTDPGAGLYSTDIDDETFTVPWSIGADQYHVPVVSSGGYGGWQGGVLSVGF